MEGCLSDQAASRARIALDTLLYDSAADIEAAVQAIVADWRQSISDTGRAGEARTLMVELHGLLKAEISEFNGAWFDAVDPRNTLYNADDVLNIWRATRRLNRARVMLESLG